MLTFQREATCEQLTGNISPFLNESAPFCSATETLNEQITWREQFKTQVTKPKHQVYLFLASACKSSQLLIRIEYFKAIFKVQVIEIINFKVF